MKTKQTLALAIAIAACSTSHAQNTFPAVGDVGINTLAPATDLQVLGVSRFGGAANYVQLDGGGNLSFNGNGNYKVGGNRYAFQFSGNPNYGLFFNSASVRYEFRDGAAVPVFFVGANDGNAAFTGGVRVGNSTLANAGNIRWNGSDFQGHNGATWITFATSSNRWGTSGNSGTTAANNFIGTTDDAGFTIRTNNSERIRVQSDGDIGIGTTTPDAKLHVFGGTDANLTGGGYIVSGDINGLSVVIDDNEIMARNAAAAGDSSTLYLNNSGGTVRTGGSLNVSDNLILEGGGKLGIATNSPARELEINHGSGSGALYGLMIANSAANNEDWTFYTENVSGDLVLYENGIERGRFNDASGAYTASSDRRMKKDIEAAGTVMEMVKRLEVKKYNFIDKTTDHKFYGLIAQDVEKIFPEIVSHNKRDDNTDGYTMDYSAFGVIAIKAIQEQQERITSQDKKIEELTKLVNQLLQNSAAGSNTITNNKTVVSGAALEQNSPNPFSSSTTIRYKVPAYVSNAQIVVANTNGNMLKTFSLTSKGAGSVTINANELAAGTYYYSLVVDGKKIDSKKMILLQ